MCETMEYVNDAYIHPLIISVYSVIPPYISTDNPHYIKVRIRKPWNVLMNSILIHEFKKWNVYSIQKHISTFNSCVLNTFIDTSKKDSR